MQTKLQSRPDLLLLLSLLLAIVLTPVLDRDGWRRLVLAGVTFIPVIVSTIRLSQIKLWVWPSVSLMLINNRLAAVLNDHNIRTTNGHNGWNVGTISGLSDLRRKPNAMYKVLEARVGA
jgi:MFS-type transporter involved in bile tolerance (Atg22 family)